MKYALVLPAMLTVAACSVRVPETDLANLCIAELAAEGSYRWNPADPVPTVTPGDGGAQRVADNINACIRGKAGV